MMSAPIVRSVSMTLSGVNRCFDPSMWERKWHPSSFSLRHAASEKTWNPPLSVSMGPSQVEKRCTPPARSMISMPGRM